jgi:hypothetical protein
MTTAHLYRVVQDGAGNLIVGANVTLCDPVSLAPIVDQIYADAGLLTPVGNPFLVMDGVIDVYLASPRTVTLSTTYGGQTQTAEWIDILPGAEMILAATDPIQITNDAFDGATLLMTSDSTAQWVTPDTTTGSVLEIIAGANVSVDPTDPQRPVVSASSAGGGMVLRGAWNSGNNYASGDCVLDGNRLYSCVSAINAPAPGAPGTDAAHWMEIAAIHDTSGRLQANDPNALADLVTLNYFNNNAVRNPPAGDLTNDLGSAIRRWRRIYAGSLVNIPTTLVPGGNAVTIDASQGDAAITLGATNITSAQILNPVTGQVLRITWIQPGTPVTYVWPSNCVFADGSGPVVLSPGYQLTVEFRYTGSAWVELSRSLTTPSTVHGIPGGGAQGQVLAKASLADYDAAWISVGGTGGTTYRGAWTAGTTYAAGDIVTSDNRTYLCLVNHQVPTTSFVGSRGLAVNGTSGFNLALPTGCAAGDLAVLAIATGGGATAVLPSGWAPKPLLMPDSATSTAQASLVLGTRALSSADVAAGQISIPAQSWPSGWTTTVFVFRGVSGLDMQSAFTPGWTTSPPSAPTMPGFLYSLAAGVFGASTPGVTIAQPSLSGLVSACGNFSALGTGYEPYSAGTPQPRTFTASPSTPPVPSQVSWTAPVLAGPSAVFFLEIGAIHDGNGRLQAAAPAAAPDLVNLDYLRRAYQRVPTPTAAADGASAALPYAHLFAQAVVNAPIAQTLAAAGAVTVNANAGDATILLRANGTSCTITGGVSGQVLRITLIQDGTGARTFVWPTSCKFADGGAGPANPVANSQLTVTLRFDGTTWVEVTRSTVASLPSGGTTGQALVKRTGSDFDAQWASGAPTAPTLGMTDCNLCTTPGWYLVANSVNSPVATRSYYVLTMVDPNSVIVGTPTYVQFATRATTLITAAAVEQWQRTGYNGTWGPWQRIGGVGTDGTANEMMGILASGLPGWTAGFAPLQSFYGNTGWTTPSASTPITSYPDGASVMALSIPQATAGGWPQNASAMVLTTKWPDAAPLDASTGWGRAFQLWVRNTGTVAAQGAMIRNGLPTGWGPWMQIAAGYNPASPTLLNSWTAYNAATYHPPQYWLDGDGMVNVGGTIKGGTVSASYTAGAAFTLPSGWRPALNRYYNLGGGANGIVVGAASAQAGNVVISSGSNSIVGLDGIRFYPDGN